jgi:hypothetical protein
MGLAQAVDHLLQDLADLGPGFRGFHLGTQFVVDGLPIQPTKLGVPVLIAHGGPNDLEGLQGQALLLRGP